MSQQFGHNSNRARLSQAQAGTSGLQPLGQQGQVGPAGVGASIQPQGGLQLTACSTAAETSELNPLARTEAASEDGEGAGAGATPAAATGAAPRAPECKGEGRRMAR